MRRVGLRPASNAQFRGWVPPVDVWETGEELDVRSPLSVARQFDQAIPDAKLVVISGAGHVTNLERPEQFNAAVREFCRSHSSPC
jgi:pimeloyl-ACP methyl ester carboxylesterase